MDISEKINLAFKNFQEGKLDQAEKFCLEVLSAEPDNSEILHLMGVTSYHRGALGHAVEYLKKAIDADNENADIFYDLGNVLQDQGKLDEALKAYESALEIEPEHPDFHNNIGMVLHDLGQIERAIDHYQKSVELNPQNAIIHNNIALAYEDNNESEKAIAHYGRAIQIDPNYADAHINIGNVFTKEDNLDTAYAYYFKAFQLNPNLVEAYVGMSRILIRMSRFAEAIPLLSRILMFYPDSAETYNDLGNALNEVGRFAEAIPHFERALQINPGYAEVHSNLGRTLGRLGNFDRATEHLNEALLLNPGLTEAINNLGYIHREKRQFGEAIACYRKALGTDQEDADAHIGLAVVELSLGNLKTGWEEYEWRLKLGGLQKRTLPQALWDGSSLEGKKLFIYPEERVGDEIMFASCLSEVLAQADHCIVECDERLVPLYGRSFPGATIVKRDNGKGYPRNLPTADFRIAIGSLPRFLRPDIGSFPRQKSYLIPDERQVEVWKNRINETGEGLKIGISWRVGGRPDEIRTRSTTVEQWADLFAVPGATFISLQYGDCREELNRAEEKLGIKIHNWEEADPLKDLDGFAAKIAALDLVMSVDNPTVHIAGALGVPAWVLLPYVCDWRWMQDFEDTPWYDSVRLFRQKNLGGWDRVFEAVLVHLRECAGAGKITDIKIAKSYRDFLNK